MANKNKKRFDPGRSILHVNKSIGGFCKSAKKGRLGKNCVHFGGSGRCNFTGRWCAYVESTETYTKLFEDAGKYHAIMGALAQAMFDEMKNE